MRRPALLAAGILLAAPAIAGAATPRTGPWHGTASEAELTFSVVEADQRREIRRLQTSSADPCLQVSVERVRIRADGTFLYFDGDVFVSGRFRSARAMSGTIDIAPAGLSCPGSELTLAATPGLSDLQRFGRCEDLAGRTVAATASARVVSRPIHAGRRYLGCVLPGGVVHPLGDARHGRSATTTLSVSAPTGRFVLVREHTRSARSDFAEGRVVDLGTGGGYPVYRDLDDGDDTGAQELSTAPPVTWRLSALGVFAGVYPDLADDYTRARSVRAFAEDGGQKLLARAAEPEIPTASLRLSGRTVTWTEGGVARAAVISEETPAYASGLEPG